MPSARWIGYWEQHGFGRQPMSDLQLEFHEGTISGSGWDIIGPFKFAGEYRSGGAVALVKQYIGQHAVLYEGWYDGEGTISGEWTVRPDKRVELEADGQVWVFYDEEGEPWGTLRGRFQMRLEQTASGGEIQELDARSAHKSV